MSNPDPMLATLLEATVNLGANADMRRFRWIREAEECFPPFHQRNYFASHGARQVTAALLRAPSVSTQAPGGLDCSAVKLSADPR